MTHPTTTLLAGNVGKELNQLISLMNRDDPADFGRTAESPV